MDAKIRAVVVEDEDKALAYLIRLLEPHRAEVEIVGEARNGDQAADLIRDQKPDLVFMDVGLPGRDGFQVSKSAPPGTMFIWMTGSLEHALRAHDYRTMGYLHKPFGEEDLSKAIGRCLEMRPARQATAPLPWSIICKVGNLRMVVWEEEIVYFEAKDKYTTVSTLTARYLTEATLKELEEELVPRSFLRIHRNCLINRKHVKHLQPLDDSQFEFAFRGIAAKVRSSRSYHKEINALYSVALGRSAGMLRSASTPEPNR